jgi:transposase InsO family protein
LAGRVLLKIVYLLTCRVLGAAVLVFRGDRAKAVELLVLRHENAVLRRHGGRVRYEPADRVWFAALAGSFPAGWTEIFPVTPATLLPWHRKLAAANYDTSRRRKPGRPGGRRSRAQQARNLSVTLGKRFEDIRFLIRDRGSNFTTSFDAVFQAAGTRILRSAVQAPRMNAICERLVGTLRRELLDRMRILGEAHLRSTLAEYQAHYNTSRPHQGIAQRVPDTECDIHPASLATVDARQIRRKPVLNGLINEYARAA